MVHVADCFDQRIQVTDATAVIILEVATAADVTVNLIPCVSEGYTLADARLDAKGAVASQLAFRHSHAFTSTRSPKCQTENQSSDFILLFFVECDSKGI